MNAKECRDTRREIDESVLGQRLSEPGQRHVVGCASCSQFLNERTHLRELVGSLEPVVAPPDFDMRLRARIARERNAPRPSFFRFAITTPGIAVAGLLVAAIAGTIWISQSKRTEVIPNAGVATGKDPSVGVAPSSGSVKKQDDEQGKPADVAINSPMTDKRSKSTDRNILKSSAATNSARVSDFAVLGAESVRRSQDRLGEVSLTAPVNPMIVSVPDERGGTRKILLPPISFGSQRLVDSRTPVSMNNSKDW